MGKCGPKPRQISTRQLRNLSREEKRALAAQRPTKQAPSASSSPRLKKRIYTRPSQHAVSLSRKKQVKIKPLSETVRRARTESSFAFSAITEEIPLFNIIKCASNLVHMPQAPVPLVCPTTPPRGTLAIGIDIPPPTLNASPELYLDGRTGPLATSRAVTTSQLRPPSPFFSLEGNAEIKFQASSFMSTFGLTRTSTWDNPASDVSLRFLDEDSRQVQVLSQLPMEQEVCAVTHMVGLKAFY